VSRYLVPETESAVPAGFVVLEQVVTAGLPHTFSLDPLIRVHLVVPTGLAIAFRDADPATVLTESDPQTSPYAPNPAEPTGNVERAPARLHVRIGGAVAGSLPLAAGARRIVRDTGSPTDGVRVEMIVLSWRIHCGTMRGPGDYGSRLVVAWRRADTAVESFSTPPVNPSILRRLPVEFRLESALGLSEPVTLNRFHLKKVVRSHAVAGQSS
jgi:hypothetical protein